MGMKEMIKGRVHSMMGSNKGDVQEDPEKSLHEMINSSPVVVFSKPTCPYCMETKETLDQHGAKYRMIDMSQIGSGVIQALGQQTGQPTVPNIFIGGTHLGGNSDLQNKGSGLKPLLQEAGAV